MENDYPLQTRKSIQDAKRVNGQLCYFFTYLNTIDWLTWQERPDNLGKVNCRRMSGVIGIAGKAWTSRRGRA